MKIRFDLVTYNGMGGHPALSFVGDFLLAGAPRSFGAAIETIDIYAHLPHTGRHPRNLASMAVQYRKRLKTLPLAWFKRKKRLVEIAYASTAGTGETLLGRRPSVVRRAPFAAACREVISLLPVVQARLKRGDRFDMVSFASQLERRLRAIPATDSALAAALARFHRPPKRPAARSKGSMPKGGPSLVALDHDDHSAQDVGKTADGRQFFLTTPFVPADDVGTATGREFLALYLFDKRGRLLSATIDDFGPRASMDEGARVRRRDELLASLGEVTPGRIVVAPFKVRRFGVEFGFIPQPPEGSDEDWSVIVEPGDYMCFWPPWTSGDYDT
jgi:hypothetical protein